MSHCDYCKQDVPLGGAPHNCQDMRNAKASTLYEKDLTEEDIKRIHALGECWIKHYNPKDREYFERALLIFSWDKKIEFTHETKLL